MSTQLGARLDTLMFAMLDIGSIETDSRSLYGDRPWRLTSKQTPRGQGYGACSRLSQNSLVSEQKIGDRN